MIDAMESGDSIVSQLGGWDFGGNVPSIFDGHVRKSVPGYELAHNCILYLTDPFIRNSSRYIDLGCSTGSLIFKVHERHKNKSFTIEGYDNEAKMIDTCKQRLDSIAPNCDKISFNLLDLVYEDWGSNVDMCTMVYTLQFIPPSIRQLVVDKIFQNLNWGGGLFLFEKVRGSDARFQDYLNHAYWQYKLNSFSAEEILGKSMSLVGTMEPFWTEGNLAMLKSRPCRYASV